MGLYKTYKTDTKLESEGVAVEVTDSPNEDGTNPTFYIGRISSSNKEYQKYIRKMSKPYERRSANGELNEETQSKITKAAFCNVIVRGWQNVFDENEQPLEFNPKNVTALMDDLPDLYRKLIGESLEMENFRVYRLEEDSKN